MIDLIGNIFTKEIFGKAITNVFSGKDSQTTSSVSPPSFSGAYMTDSNYESQAGQAETIDTTDPNMVLLSWQRRLFDSKDSYTKITLPSIGR